jgi:hypothetical protein
VVVEVDSIAANFFSILVKLNGAEGVERNISEIKLKKSKEMKNFGFLQEIQSLVELSTNQNLALDIFSLKNKIIRLNIWKKFKDFFVIIK